MTNRLSDQSLYRMSDAFYPRGHVFAMFADADAAEETASKLREVRGIGLIDVVSAEAIIEGMQEGAQKTGGMPSVGREHQFMRRFVELAHKGCGGLLAEVASADIDAMTSIFLQQPVELAYFYRPLVIEELVDSTKRADDAAAGQL